MPEYLAPGVYIEETSYRAKSIEGVATSTAGFVGQCRTGPIEGSPLLITSFEEFRRSFGGLGDLQFSTGLQTNYLAHAVKAFFENGGRRVYIGRVFKVNTNSGTGFAESADLAGTKFKSRFPGRAGNVKVRVAARRSGNLKTGTGGTARLRGLRAGDLVEVNSTALPRETRELQSDGSFQSNLDKNRLAIVTVAADGEIGLDRPGDTSFTWKDQDFVQRVAVTVEVIGAERVDVFNDLSAHPDSVDFIATALREVEPRDRDASVYLDTGTVYGGGTDALVFGAATDILEEYANLDDQQLTEGDDGAIAAPADFEGGSTNGVAKGLEALAEIEDIAIVAAPGCGALGATQAQALRNTLISHCERMQYRIAVLSGPANQDISGIRDVRAMHDSTRAAIYYPWVIVNNPGGQGGQTLALPPDGFVAGIYARSDVERGVHKAPANEVVRGALRFERPINQGTQDVLNPEGINCLRYFAGRGYRVWGGRTISSDPEWKYVNVRRLFIFLEHSIDRNTQWAVFEPNNEELWLKVRLTIQLFLEEVWRSGALLGKTPDEAFFVRCDRTTMTQSDLDNGRLVCLIGVAPTKPAEYVVFRIGQWTADASIV